MNRPDYVSPDMEWYDDGFTIEEQRQLKRMHKPIKLSVTEKFQKESADKLISKLRQELAAANEYIAELEENNKTLINKNKVLITEVEKANAKCKQVLDKYSVDKNNTISLDETYKTLKERIKELTFKVKTLTETKDLLIWKLNNGN